MMDLTREQRERLVLDLLDQNKNTREIATQVKMSLRDIGAIKRNAGKQKEAEQEQAREELLSSQAYKLFSERKTPAEVAIELKIRAPQAIIFQREYWNLMQLDNLNQIYQEIKHNIQYVVELYRLAKAAGFRAEHIPRLLRIANHDLQLVDCKYENLKTNVETLEEYKRISEGRLGDLNNQITEASNHVEYYKTSCRQEETKMNILRQKRIKLEALIRQFETNNSEYTKIRKTAEEKVLIALSDRKGLLKLAFLSLAESMRKDPEKYSTLIFDNIPSTIHYSNHQYPQYGYGFYTYGQEHWSREDYIGLLVEEADKLYNKLLEDLVDKSIADYSTHSTTSSFPSFPPPDKE